jgi:hypothetical protein
MRSRNHIVNAYKILLWISSIILFGVLIADVFNYFSDIHVINSGIRPIITKPFNKEAILRIFLIGNYQSKIPFYFFFRTCSGGKYDCLRLKPI